MNSSFFVTFLNELTIGEDGWAMIAPIGDFISPALIPNGKGGVKKQKAIQRYDARALEQIVANFHNSRKGLNKYLRGLPIYVGHPDVPGFEKLYPDAEPKGVFADLQARPNGLYGLPVFTNEGSDLVERKIYRALSGNAGNSEPDGEKIVDGKPLPVFRPTELFSVGLTNTPRLPVEFLNEAEGDDAQAESKDTMKKDAVIALFTTLGILTSKGVAFANDASDEEFAEGLKQLGEKAKTATQFANEKAQLESKLTAKDGEINTLKSEKGTLTTERDTARTQFANERAARIEDVLGLSLRLGLITDAERPTWKGRLENQAQFANEVATITKLEPKLKTKSKVEGRTPENADLADPRERRQFINEAIDNVCQEKGWDRKKDYDRAFRQVQKLHPAIFANMQHPEVKQRK